MPKLATPLTDIQARNAKPKDKPYKLSDGGGMYLEVMPTGLRVWRMGFTQANGKKNKITFGTYPETSLLEAREKRAAARKQLSDGIDPGQDKKDKNRIKGEKANQTFEKLAREWHANKLSTWSEATAKKNIRCLEIDIFPAIGKMPIASITHQHIIAELRKIELRGALEIAHRVKAICARIFSYANQQGIDNRNPALT